MEISNSVVALAALAQASRLTVFRLLVQAGSEGLPAGKIAEMTGITPSSLSFHLKELTHAEMLHVRHEGRFVIYSANFDKMNELIRFLTENCCQGAACTPAITTCDC